MKSILDPSFRYVKSTDTDLRKTFARLRREQRKQSASKHGNVLPFAETRAHNHSVTMEESVFAGVASAECRP